MNSYDSIKLEPQTVGPTVHVRQFWCTAQQVTCNLIL
jgi:hypothetical protein